MIYLYNFQYTDITGAQIRYCYATFVEEIPGFHPGDAVDSSKVWNFIRATPSTAPKFRISSGRRRRQHQSLEFHPGDANDSSKV
jgi:hypothetical protein